MNINATLLGQMITFAIFVWFTMRVLWPLLNSQLEDRKKTIAEGLAAAEEGKKILLTAEIQTNKKMYEMRKYCNKILERTNIEANLILENIRKKAYLERNEIINAGHKTIDRAVKQAQKELLTQVAEIAILGAEKILQRNITSTDHEKALNEIIKTYKY